MKRSVRHKMISLLAALALLASGCGGAPRQPEAEQPADGSAGSPPQSVTGPYTASSLISEVSSDPVFGKAGRLLFPVQSGYASGTTLGSLRLTWYSPLDADETVAIVNRLYEDAAGGKTIFYDIYSDQEKAADPDKADTGLFFFRGQENGKTAVLNAGGGFAYVGAMQDSFPAARELSNKGYNAFALIYRPDAELACEDLARAVAFLFEHESELGIDMTDYSLWGGSAGARMADWVGTYGTAAFGEAAFPQPAMVVTQYTGLSEVTGDEPPTYANVGTSDYIADADVMSRRIRQIQANGTDAMIEVFPGLSHGFGIGTGTAAEGWIDNAVAFWEQQMTEKTVAAPKIPQEIQPIPQEYFRSGGQPGTLHLLSYDTWESFSYGDHTRRVTKQAVVYLPYGYDPQRRYDVFYLMHGGWSDETSTLGAPDAPSLFKNVLDNAIAAKEIRPLIVVCPTYNNTNAAGRDSDDFALALRLTDRYHQELLNDLMPAVEGTYSTYAAGTSVEDFTASRDHRGFGGFSMGSVATWHTFQYCLDEFRWFLPMSCGTTLDDETIWAAAETRSPGDYFVFLMTGSEDFAGPYDQNRSAEMAASPCFTSVDEDPGGNFAFRLKPGYRHDGTAAMEYTYNGLKAFFPG